MRLAKWPKGGTPPGIYILMLLLSTPVYANDMLQVSGCVKGSLLLERRLEKEFVADDFHIFYSLDSKDALIYLQNSNGDGVPDTIKDIAVQLQAAKYLYSSVLGLQFPLQQKIFSRARQINVYLLTLPKGNGLAFDRVASETMSDGKQIPCGLKIVLNAALKPAQNITPAHELFHLYQYGYAVFKQQWYLEGMARWMEDAFKPGEKRTKKLTVLPTCESQYSRGYGAANYWASYAQSAFNPKWIGEMQQKYHYQDGSPVFKINMLPGGGMIRPFFHQLSLTSAKVSQKVNLANTRWPEKSQRAPQFNSVICQALQGTDSETK